MKTHLGEKCHREAKQVNRTQGALVKIKWLNSERGLGDGSQQGCACHWPRGRVPPASWRPGAFLLWEGEGHTVPSLGPEGLDKALF